MTEKTIEELQKEIKKKEKALKDKETAALESPFAAVGGEAIATPIPRPRGRPPGSVNKVDDTPVEVRQAEFNQRMSEIARPASDSSNGSMREWAEKEIHSLLPEAVASLKQDIKYGSAKERADARKEIFAATGVDKKQLNAFNNGGGITINFGANGVPQGINLPFLQRTEQPNTIVSTPIVETLGEGRKKDDF